MKVMITGGLGGLGQYIVEECLHQGHDVVIFDIKNKNTIKSAKKFPSTKIIFGDITKPESYGDLISDLDAIIHLAFILTPLSEKLPFSESVNVTGTKLLIESVERINPDCKFIFASSVSVFGPTMWHKSPLGVNTPLNPTNNYTKHKATCEMMLQESSLNWLILRIAEAPYLKFEINPNNLERMYEIPHNNRVEFVHPKDVALAFANAVTTLTNKEIYIVAGGRNCRMLFGEQVDRIFETLGLPKSDKKKYSTSAYYLDYYDTKRSQEILKYQTRSFDDWIQDFQKEMGITKDIISFFAPIAKFFI